MYLTHDKMVALATSVMNDLGDPSVSDAYSDNPKGLEWVHYAPLPTHVIEQLANNAGFSTPDEAQEWLETEIQMIREDGDMARADMYESLLLGRESVEEAIVCGNGANDGYWLWDGTHRVAAVYANGGKLSGIVGHGN